MTAIEQLKQIIEIKKPEDRRVALSTFLRYSVASVTFSAALPGHGEEEIGRLEHETRRAIHTLVEMAVRECMTEDRDPFGINFRLLLLKVKP